MINYKIIFYFVVFIVIATYVATLVPNPKIKKIEVVESDGKRLVFYSESFEYDPINQCVSIFRYNKPTIVKCGQINIE